MTAEMGFKDSGLLVELLALAHLGLARTHGLADVRAGGRMDALNLRKSVRTHVGMRGNLSVRVTVGE